MPRYAAFTVIRHSSWLKHCHEHAKRTGNEKGAEALKRAYVAERAREEAESCQTRLSPPR
jgi:hypothetical protein